MKALPTPGAALFRLLARPESEVQLADSDWRALLAFADRTQLTLHLRGAQGLPPWLHGELENRFLRNAERRKRLRQEFQQVSYALNAAGIDFVVLKGFTHEAGFGFSGNARVQYDIDLLCPQAGAARRALQQVGYSPHGSESLSDEHERPLVRSTGWQWRGDYFDPDMPVAIEVHATPWNPSRDRLPVEDFDAFWDRRGWLDDERLAVPAYAEPDRLAFAALHALRHILRNDARPSSVYELARFLETRRSDADFWSHWQALHSPGLRSLQAVAFCFARDWFGASFPAAVSQSVESLPPGVQDWFRHFAWSPVANLIGPNKDALWLHAALLRNLPDRIALLRERLFPLRLPHHAEAGPYRQRLLRRFGYHAAGSALAVVSGVRWWSRRTARSTAVHNSDWNRSSV